MMQLRGKLWTRAGALAFVLFGLAACVPPQGGDGAAGAGGADGGLGGGLMTILPLILIFGVFYFLIIRPQQRKSKMHRQMLEGVRRGDQVVTGGGIIGNVVKVDRDDNLHVEIADGVRVKVTRASVSEVIQRPTPIGDDEDEDDDDGDYEEEAEASEDEEARGSSKGRKKDEE